MHEDVEMTFGEHLEELRRRVMLAVAGLLVATALCAIFYEPLLVALMRPYKVAYDSLLTKDEAAAEDEGEGGKTPDGEVVEPDVAPLPADNPLAPVINRLDRRLAAIEKRLDVVSPETAPPKPGEKPAHPAYSAKFPPPRLIQGSPMTGYVTIIMLAMICGAIIGSPWILYQIWAFVGVGLHAHEQRFVRIYGPFSFFLFIGGAATFYLLLLPVGLQALMSPTAGIVVDGVSMVDSSFFLNDYFRFVAVMTLIFGVVFQTPLIVMFIARTEIVPLATLFKQQRFVILVLCVLAAMFTPPDPVTMVMMAVPLILLYQLGLLLAWFSLRRRKKELAEEERLAAAGSASGSSSGDDWVKDLNADDGMAQVRPATPEEANFGTSETPGASETPYTPDTPPAAADSDEPPPEGYQERPGEIPDQPPDDFDNPYADMTEPPQPSETNAPPEDEPPSDEPADDQPADDQSPADQPPDDGLAPGDRMK